jgi:enoyl-CoA hydratase
VITYERAGEEGAVGLVTLDRPERRNALRPEHWAALAEHVREAPSQGARVVVITGAGSAFCAGADLADISVEEMSAQVENAFAVVREVPVPVIAHVNGPAVGAGAQLTVSCDLRVVAPEGRFRIPAAAISMLVHPGTIRRLVAVAGVGPARAVLLGGDWISAERAIGLGMADRAGTLSDAIAWADEIASGAPVVLQYLKAQLQVPDPDPADDYPRLLRELLVSEDFAEAARSRAEERPARYVGR